MKVSLSVIEATDIFRPDSAPDTSVYCTVKHEPSGFLVRSERFVTDSNVVKLPPESQSFTFPIDTLTEPVTVTLYTGHEDCIAYRMLNLTDFSDGAESDKWFDLLPSEGYSENGRIHLRIRIDGIPPPENAPPAADSPREQDSAGYEEEADEQGEERRPHKTKEERNREKAALLNQNYDRIFEAAKEAAQNKYQQLLAENAQLLLSNENWVNGETTSSSNENVENNQNPNSPPKTVQNEPELESSESD